MQSKSFNHKPLFQSPAGKLPYLIRGLDRCAESLMSKIDWSLVEAEVKATPVLKRKNDLEASERSEVDVLKHIEDALRMDAILSDRTSARRG